MHLGNQALKIKTLEKVWVWLLLALFMLSHAHIYLQIEIRCHFLELIYGSFLINLKIQQADKTSKKFRHLVNIGYVAFLSSLLLSFLSPSEVEFFLVLFIASVSAFIGLMFSIAINKNDIECKRYCEASALKSAACVRYTKEIFGKFAKLSEQNITQAFILKLKINFRFITMISSDIKDKLRTVSVNLTPRLLLIPEYNGA